MNKKDSLGDRMKKYENIFRIYLTPRLPVIIRIDGCHFHSFTKKMNRPFDDVLINTMQKTAQYLCEHIEGCKMAYTQSDEISLLLTDDDTITTQAWFDKNLQKICSVAASMATMIFNQSLRNNIPSHTENFETYYEACEKGAYFDARAFVLPKEEVCNYFIWRQQDASRNSIQMLGRANFSHKALENKSCSQIQDILIEQKSINWNDLPTVYKRGTCVVRKFCNSSFISEKSINEEILIRRKWIIDTEIPIFTTDRNYIESKMILENK